MVPLLRVLYTTVGMLGARLASVIMVSHRLGVFLQRLRDTVAGLGAEARFRSHKMLRPGTSRGGPGRCCAVALRLQFCGVPSDTQLAILLRSTSVGCGQLPSAVHWHDGALVLSLSVPFGGKR